MDKKDTSIIEIIEKMISEGESDERVIKTLRDFGVPEEKAQKLLRIAQADTFSILRREVKKIVEQQLEEEKPVLKKFIEEEAMQVADETRKQLTKAVISDLKEYEQDITGQSRTLQEQIKDDMAGVIGLSEKVKVKLNELGEAIKHIQSSRADLTTEEQKQMQSIKAQMGQLNETIKTLQTTKVEPKQLQPITEDIKQLQEMRTKMNQLAESLRQIQTKASMTPVEAKQVVVGETRQLQEQLQDTRGKLGQITEALKALQAKASMAPTEAKQAIAGETRQLQEQLHDTQNKLGQIADTIKAIQSKPTTDVKQVQEMRDRIGQLTNTIKDMQSTYDELKQQVSMEDIRQMQEMRAKIVHLTESLKQMQSRPTTTVSDNKPLQEMRTKLFELNEAVKLLQARPVVVQKTGFFRGAGGKRNLLSEILWAVGLIFGLANLYFLYNVFGKPLTVDSLIVMTVMALLTITLLFIATEMQPEAEVNLTTMRQ